MDTYYSEDILEKYDKFKQGCFLIFKKWQAFRFSLDNNPELLTVYSDEERTELEIYTVLRVLLSDIDDEINKYNSKVVINMIAEMLYDFMTSYFNLELDDKSENFVARDIYNLHGEIFKEEKYTFLEQLKKIDSESKLNFYIDFPISKKSVENKILSDKMEKMVIDDEQDDECDSDEDEENENNLKEDKTCNDAEKDITQNMTTDAEGFVEVKKNKENKKKKNEKNMEIDNVVNKKNDNIPDAEGFVEIKKKKKK